ncbi:hypothetical protein CVT26_005596 [Gymnopilus dilepis]|uniref:Carbonic anhydrase n=1 Tax=Gymnopilus dilepis TaxID=231916 RepID=A0A409XZL1_9AGAR|nr:hypothetical protein CVT26_005596 [Gymnopilus dilepis]
MRFMLDPPFMFFGCSDSRVSEGTVFNALPGTLFAERNISNQFLTNDNNAQSALGYSVQELGVTHVIVMGHYGCGGVAAAMKPRPPPPISVATSSVLNWIDPIRSLLRVSERPELVAYRKEDRAATFDPFDVDDPAFRALVEENVKANVIRIFESAIIQNHYNALKPSLSTHSVSTIRPVFIPQKADPPQVPHPVFIHGLVYDLATGRIFNLNVSRGPPGVPIPPVPFPLPPNN